MFRALAASTPSSFRLISASLMMSALIGLAAPHKAFADDDPPSRVGRLAVIDGTVSFHTADQQTWGAATQNYPITTGNAVWADANSHAAVEIGGNDINLGSQSELDVDQLTDQILQASLPQGSVYLNLRNLNQGDQYQIATPRGTVNILRPGRYEISSGDQTHPSQVTVLEGAAQISGDNNLNLAVGPGQSGILSDDGQGGQVRANLAASPGEDSLVAWAHSREPQAAPPPETAAMTGTQDLGRYGSWSSSPDYGNVWYPQVQADWVPYRAGHWAWVAPWGWTWVDDAPWGFAPFHYGRWVQIGPRWAWAPRPVVVVAAPIVPVYAPALVSFVGDIGGVGIGISIGGPSVGWVPLGPREVYYPPYRVSDRYARNVNVTYVKNVNIINVHNTTVINRNVTVNNYVNHGAVTVVNRDVMAHSQRVSGSVQHVNQQDLDHMRGFNGDHAPLKPTAQTVGLTPNEAKHYGVTPQEMHQSAAAGPAIKEHNTRNWNNQQASGKPQNVQVKNGQTQAVQTPSAQKNGQQQNGQQQNGQTNKHWSNQNKWASQGSHKPGAAVTMPSNGAQPNAATTHDQQKPNGGQAPAAVTNNQQSGKQEPGKQQLSNNRTLDQSAGNSAGSTKQRKLDWSKNQQSHQPGAPVQAPGGVTPQVPQTQSQQLQNQLKQQDQARQQENNQQQLQKQQKQWQQQQTVQRQQQEQAKQQQTVQRQQQEQLKQQQKTVQRQQAQQQEQLRQQQHQAEQQRVQQQQNAQRANQQHNKPQQPAEPVVQPQ